MIIPNTWLRRFGRLVWAFGAGLQESVLLIRCFIGSFFETAVILLQWVSLGAFQSEQRRSWPSSLRKTQPETVTLGFLTAPVTALLCRWRLYGQVTASGLRASFLGLALNLARSEAPS